MKLILFYHFNSSRYNTLKMNWFSWMTRKKQNQDNLKNLSLKEKQKVIEQKRKQLKKNFKLHPIQ